MFYDIKKSGQLNIINNKIKRLCQKLLKNIFKRS